MHYNPSPATYLITAAAGAATPLLAASPALASLAPITHAAAEAAPWWGPMIVSGAAGIGGPILLWVVKTFLGGALKSGAAAMRAWASSIRAKAKATPDKSDDGPAEMRAAAVDAAARQLEESGKTIPFGQGKE